VHDIKYTSAEDDESVIASGWSLVVVVSLLRLLLIAIRGSLVGKNHLLLCRRKGRRR
jgi:hypothetical protein